MSDSKKQLFIGSNLNDIYVKYGTDEEVMPLRNPVLISLLKKEYGEILDGMKIWLSANTKNNDKQDPTIFPGTIRDIGKKDEYEILVDEKEMQYLSESEQFKDYSIEDVLDRSKYTEEDKRLSSR